MEGAATLFMADCSPQGPSVRLNAAIIGWRTTPNNYYLRETCWSTRAHYFWADQTPTWAGYERFAGKPRAIVRSLGEC